MLGITKQILPFFISFPPTVSFYFCIYFISTCQGNALSDFIWNFNIVNCFFCAPLLAGIFTDSVGVVNLLPFYDILSLFGQALIYWALASSNEILISLGCFSICFAFGLKESSKSTYLANTFIKKEGEGYNLKNFMIQHAITVSSRYLVLLIFSLFSSEQKCQNIRMVCLASLALTGVGLLASITLKCINKKDLRYARINQTGHNFLDYNDRLHQNEREIPTMSFVGRTVFTDFNFGHVKFWLVGTACFFTLGLLNIPYPLFPEDLNYLDYLVPIVITLLLSWAWTEERMRYLTIFAGVLIFIFQLVCIRLEIAFAQWILLLTTPISLLFADAYTPILVEYDLKYYGILIGIKKWFENFFMLLASVSHLANYYTDYQLALAVLGLIFIGVFARLFSKIKMVKSMSLYSIPQESQQHSLLSVRNK